VLARADLAGLGAADWSTAPLAELRSFGSKGGGPTVTKTKDRGLLAGADGR
jgi:hypothetical protein